MIVLGASVTLIELQTAGKRRLTVGIPRMTRGGSFWGLLGCRKVAAKALRPRRRSLSNARIRRPSFARIRRDRFAGVVFLAHLDFFFSANPRHAFPIDFEAFPPHQRGDRGDIRSEDA